MKDFRTKKRSLEINADLKAALKKRSEQKTDAAGREVMVLEEGAAAGLADQFGLHPGQVFEAALEAGICPVRYLRNRETISLPEQLKLARSCIGIVGAGGLGGQVISLLARVGVGRLIVIDHDCFDESNLNRQALSFIDSLGRSKAQQAVKWVQSINPAVRVEGLQIRLDPSNAEEALFGADLVIDALDNIPDRFLIENTAKKLGLPLVHGAVAGLEGQIMTVFPGDEGLKMIYGPAGEESRTPDNPELVFGVPAFTPALIGTYQALEAIKIILKKGTVFQNRMVHFDLEGGRWHEIKFKVTVQPPRHKDTKMI